MKISVPGTDGKLKEKRETDNIRKVISSLDFFGAMAGLV
jgi:hypothetical protein